MFDKISPLELMQFLVTPRGSKKDFEDAVEYLKEEYENDAEMPPLIKAMKISKVRRELKEFTNMHGIIQHAISFGMSYENMNQGFLDDDWCAFFLDKAKNICCDDAKILWGKLLSEESKNNGCIPKQLVHILSIMSADDAADFDNVCKFAVNRIFDYGLGKGMLIIAADESTEILKSVRVSYQKLNDLQSLGLLKVNAIDDRLILKNWHLEQACIGFEYHGNIIEIGNLREQVPIGYVSLTEVGRILSNIVVRKSVDGFLDYIKNYYEKNGFTVNIKIV